MEKQCALTSGKRTDASHQSSYSTRQTIQCQPHDGQRHDGAAGHDGFQAPHPGVSISEVCHLGNDAGHSIKNGHEVAVVEGQ